jgi:aspartyl-tRNA(Asn)/glutamyl-tRNA(Gln) amidotransferase subunit C
MTDINEVLTRKVADLARLELSDSEVKLFTSQLGDILRYVEKLGEARVDGVDPLTHPTAAEHETPLREDEARPLEPWVDGGYRVPPIL